MPALPSSPTPPPPRRRFRPSHRLSGRREFAAVYQARVFKSAGPLTLHSRPNGLGRHRLGLSVGRRVGKAVTRNLIKRRLREAFRLSQHEWPAGAAAETGGADGGYDLVVGVRPHPLPLPMAEYAALMGSLVRQADAVWRRRCGKAGRAPAQPPAEGLADA